MAASPHVIAESFQRLERLREGPLTREPASCLTRADLEPVLVAYGVTRVCSLTGLDRIGIPIWAAMRPASRSLAVSAGKGLVDEAAWTSAVMESLEQARAERAADLVDLVDTRGGLARRGLSSVPLSRQSRCALRSLDPEREMAWVKGISWRTGEHVYAPYELVGLDMQSGAPWDTSHFRMTSSGLASGANQASAITHGLCELLEDDALFAAMLPRAGTASRAVCFDHGRGVLMREAIDRLGKAGVEAQFMDLQHETGLPVIAATLVPDIPGQPCFTGFCCRLSREDAALGALLEAVQCRAVFISGARDDLYEESYHRRPGSSSLALFAPCQFVEQMTDLEPAATSLGEVARLVYELTRGDFYVFPLGGSAHGFEAVRVLADDLVSLHTPAAFPRTGRAAAKLLHRWASA